MGYCFSVMDSQFEIASHHYSDLMDHLIKWHTKMKETNCQLKWIEHDRMIEILQEGDIINYFSHWQYGARIDLTTGNICDLVFEGEKIGDEENLFEQIAPWVTDDSRLDCQGEDNALWRWCWRQGNFFNVEAEIHYPDPVDMGMRPTATVLLNDELNAARVANGWESNASDPATQAAITAFLNQPAPPPDTQYALNAFRGKNATQS